MTTKHHIYIFGDGIIGALSAAYISRKLPNKTYHVTYFDNGTAQETDYLYSTCHADTRRLNKEFNLKEADFIRQTDAVFSLGEKFSEPNERQYVNTYCPYGLSLEGLDFLSVMQTVKHDGNLNAWEDYNLPAKMIRNHKFNPPDHKGRPIISDFTFGYQSNPKHYSELLLEQAKKFGASIASAESIEDYSSDEAGIWTITSHEHGTIQPKLIINTLSSNSALSGGPPFDKPSDWKPSHIPDMTYDVAFSRDEIFLNHIAHNISSSSVTTRISLQSKLIEIAIKATKGKHPLRLGKEENLWNGNIVKLGGSFGLLPIFGAPLRINQIALESLIKLFPSGAKMHSERLEYNAQMERIFDRFDEFQTLWLKLSPFKCEQDINLSNEAQHKLKLFETRGKLPHFEDDNLFQDQWISLFLGQGVWPKNTNPLAKNLSRDSVQRFQNEFKAVVNSAHAQMPTTTKFIYRHCPTLVSDTKKEPLPPKTQTRKNDAHMSSSSPLKSAPLKSPALKSIVIAGGGTAGWMTAAALSRSLGCENVSITLIESESIGTVGVGEATIPNIASFNAMLGIDEATFMKATQATIKYGIEFVGWSQENESYFHPFGQHGQTIAGLSFHQLWKKTYDRGAADRIENYCATAMAAKHGKACLPPRDPASILSSLSHAYQFDSGRYAQFLRQYSEVQGVDRIEGKITDVDLLTDNGHIKSVTLENGKTIEADFFIDCTGFRALLSNKALQVDYEDWSKWLPCNSAQAVGSQKTSKTMPYTRATARKAGWQWRIPLQHRTGNGYVYSSDFIEDQEVTETLLQSLDGDPLGTPKQLRFTTGQRKFLWHKNCVAIGLSGGFLEPLESTSIYLIQAGISRLLALFPDQSFNPVEREEYNKLMSLEFEQVRDFLILHYIANNREGEPFWDYLRHMPIPDSLTRKIELFRNKGAFFRYDGDLFSETSWVAVFLGQNIQPNGYNALVDGLPEKDVEHALKAIKSEIQNKVPHMPTHDEFLSKYCPAPQTL